MHVASGGIGWEPIKLAIVSVVMVANSHYHRVMHLLLIVHRSAVKLSEFPVCSCFVALFGVTRGTFPIVLVVIYAHSDTVFPLIEASGLH